MPLENNMGLGNAEIRDFEGGRELTEIFVLAEAIMDEEGKIVFQAGQLVKAKGRMEGGRYTLLVTGYPANEESSAAFYSNQEKDFNLFF